MNNTCNNCGGALKEGDKFCQSCGAPVPEVNNNQSVNTGFNESTPVSNNNQYNQTNTNGNSGKTSGTAIGGLVCGILGFFVAGIPMGIVALSLGISAKKHYDNFPQDKGKGMAIAAIVLGIINIVLTSIGLILKYL